MTVLWVLWHRLRGHWTEPSGWQCYAGQSKRIWHCLSCPTRSGAHKASYGWAPEWLRWREQG